MTYSKTKNLSSTIRRILSLSPLLFSATIAFADFKAPPESVEQLVHWETKSNAVSTRSSKRIALNHYEIPLSEVSEDISKSMDPNVYQSLVFTKGDKKYVRWIINPEDTKWHLILAAYLKGKGLDATPKTYFSAYLTSSRSLIVVDPKTGASFSAKASTNQTGGNWRDKQQPFDDAFQARKSSDMVSSVQRRMKFNHLVLLEEPGMFGIKDVDQAILIRSLGDLPTSDKYYLPGFSAVHDATGAKIAKLNGSNDPAAFWNEHYNKKLARAYAEFSAHFGLTYDSPHSQNFLIELDEAFKPTGRIVLRDFVDGYAQEDFLKAARQDEFLRTWDPDNITHGDLYAPVGIMHGNEYPSWLNDKIYRQWGKDFYEAYEDEFSKLTGIDKDYLKKSRFRQNDRYFSKNYSVDHPEWQKYFDLADCFFGFVKTRSGLDCPKHLKDNILPHAVRTQACPGLLTFDKR